MAGKYKDRTIAEWMLTEDPKEQEAIAIDIAGSTYDITNLYHLILTVGKGSTSEYMRSSRSFKSYGPTSRKALRCPIQQRVKCEKSKFNRAILILDSSTYYSSHTECYANSFEPYQWQDTILSN